MLVWAFVLTENKVVAEAWKKLLSMEMVKALKWPEDSQKKRGSQKWVEQLLEQLKCLFLFQRTAPELWNDKCEVIYPNLDLTHGAKSEAVGVYQAFLSDR